MTIKEIAKLAGVSTATVSYVINNSAPVREETKEKIRTIIRDTGYTGNSIAKSLRVNKTKTLGIIVEDMKSEQVPILIDGIHECAERYGYKTLVSNMRLQSKQHCTHLNSNEADAELEKSITTLLGMQVDGILYVGAYNDKLIVPPKIAKPLVLCNCFSDDPSAITISYDNEDAAYQMTKELIQLGHSRIGLVTGFCESYSVIERKKGYLRALKEFKIPMKDNYIVNGSWGFHRGKDAVKELLNQTNPPSAIFAMNDAMAIGAYEAATEFGYQVPDDISVAGFDNAESTKYLRPRMSTVSIPLKEMGTISTEYLIGNIEGEPSSEVNVQLKCELILRNSTSIHHEKFVIKY